MGTAIEPSEEDSILKCGICFEIMTDPKLLECRHAFCTYCISHHFKENKDNCAPCPVCRQSYWPPHRNPELLPSCSIPLCQLLEIKKKNSPSCESKSCEQSPAPYICVKCRKWLCHSCKDLECCTDSDDPISTKYHDVHRKSNTDPRLFDIVVQSRCAFCREHQEHKLRWFCLKCEKLVCQLCRRNCHLHHELTDIKIQSNKFRESLTKSRDFLKRKEQDNRHTGHIFRTLLLNCNRNMSCDVSSKWQKILDSCENDSEECDSLIHLITLLLLYGSTEVIINTFLLVEKRIKCVLQKCHCKEFNDEQIFLQKYSESFCEYMQAKTTICCTRNNSLHKVCLCANQHSKQCVTQEQRKGHNKERPTKGNKDDERNLRKQRSDQMVENLDSGKSGNVSSCENGDITKSVLQLICDSCKAKICESASNNELDHPTNKCPFLRNVVAENKPDMCESHPEHLASLFCEHCKKPICEICQKHGHEDHEILSVEKQKTIFCNELRKKMQEIDKKVTSYEKIKTTIRQIQEGPMAEALSLGYLENIISLCKAKSQECDDCRKGMDTLLHCGSDHIIIRMFPKIMSASTEVLCERFDDLLKPLQQMGSYMLQNLKELEDNLNLPGLE